MAKNETTSFVVWLGEILQHSVNTVKETLQSSSSLLVNTLSNTLLWPRTLYDWYRLVRYRDEFIFSVLVPRSIESGQGYCRLTLPIPFKSLHILVITGQQYIPDATYFAETNKKSGQIVDPRARMPFDVFKNVSDIEMIANLTGEKGRIEHNRIKMFTGYSQAIPISIAVYQKMLRNWDPSISLNDRISHTSINIIAQAWFNIPEIELEVTQLISKGEHYLVDLDPQDPADLSGYKAELNSHNRRILNENEARIVGSKNYLADLLERKCFKQLQESEPLFGLMVEGNITTLITCAIIYIASHGDIRDKLKEEVDSLEGDFTETMYQRVRTLNYLNLLYLESLRYFGPGLPVVRYASCDNSINGLAVSANTHIITPLKSILHDPAVWGDPQSFRPERHQNEGVPKLNVPPFVPFSHGGRMCPAASGFAESMFKICITNIFRDYEIILKSHDDLERMPVNTKLPRLAQTYYADLIPKVRLAGAPIVHQCTFRATHHARHVEQEALISAPIMDTLSERLDSTYLVEQIQGNHRKSK